MKVLVVDDEPDVARLISISFGMQQPNWEILATAEGEEALDLVEQKQPDVVLLDVGLPDTEGFEVLKQIRLFSDVPVIMLTIKREEDDKVRGLVGGAQGHLTGRQQGQALRRRRGQ